MAFQKNLDIQKFMKITYFFYPTHPIPINFLKNASHTPYPPLNFIQQKNMSLSLFSFFNLFLFLQSESQDNNGNKIMKTMKKTEKIITKRAPTKYFKNFSQNRQISKLKDLQCLMNFIVWHYMKICGKNVMGFG